MFVGILRTTKFAVQNSWRNLWLSIVTVFLLVLTTFSITLVVGLNVVGQNLIHAVQDKVDIDFYFYSYVQEEDILDAQQFLQHMAEVKSVVYESQQDAEEWFSEKHQNDSIITETLDEFKDEDILPARLIVQTHNLEDYPKIIDRFGQSDYSEYIDDADYSDHQEIIANMSNVKNKAYQIGIGVSIIFIIISVIVIFNTIRITIYSYREEVSIMKLVGATNWFIRAPFIFEGIILGVVSACITIAIFILVLMISDASIQSFFTGYNFSVLQLVQQYLLEFILIEIAVAVLLSVLSGMVAITRYLKV